MRPRLRRLTAVALVLLSAAGGAAAQQGTRIARIGRSKLLPPKGEIEDMREYLRDRLIRVGLGLLVLGSGPLLAIIIAARVGLLHDPDPNPVGPGMLAGLTFWPALICLVAGVARVRRGRRA